MPTESAQQALSHLRDPSDFQWYVIPIFALVIYVYSVEIERRNWSLVFAGLATAFVVRNASASGPLDLARTR